MSLPCPQAAPGSAGGIPQPLLTPAASPSFLCVSQIKAAIELKAFSVQINRVEFAQRQGEEWESRNSPIKTISTRSRHRTGTRGESARLSPLRACVHLGCFSAYEIVHGLFFFFYFGLNFGLQIICSFSLLCCHISDRFFFFLPPFLFFFFFSPCHLQPGYVRDLVSDSNNKIKLQNLK